MQKQRAKASHVCVISELLPKYFMNTLSFVFKSSAKSHDNPAADGFMMRCRGSRVYDRSITNQQFLHFIINLRVCVSADLMNCQSVE